MRMIVARPLNHMRAGNRLALFLPLLIVLHLGLAHTDHLAASSIDTGSLGHSTETHHVSVAEDHPDDSVAECPVPSVTFRAEPQDSEQISPELLLDTQVESPAEFVVTAAIAETPKRLDGPSRQAILQCFRL